MQVLLLNTVPAFHLKRLPDLKKFNYRFVRQRAARSSNCSRNEVELISPVCEDLPRINPQIASARPHLGSQSFIQCEACNLLRQLPHEHVVVCLRGWPSVTVRILNRVVHSCTYQYTFIYADANYFGMMKILTTTGSHGKLSVCVNIL